jgi:excisionase family DNA binding protein
MTPPNIAPGQGSTVGSASMHVVPLMTVPEVADFLRLHPKTVYDLVARSELPCVRVGSAIRFDARDIASWVSARKEG